MSKQPTPLAREIAIPALDGFALAATSFEGSGSSAALIAPAVGVRRGFYSAFASYLAAHGITAVAIDYRGMDDRQRPGAAAASLTAWAKKDVAGALEWIAREISPGRLFLVGHSLGAQIVGMLPNASGLDGVVAVSLLSGYFGFASGWNRALSAALFHGFMPATAALLGYFPAHLFGLGSDLPAGAAREWASWCRDPRYLLGSVSEDDLRRYASFDKPLLTWTFTDDPYATPAAVDAMHRVYPSAPITRRLVNPLEVGLPPIGHVGFFRERARPLWAETGEWMERVAAD